MDIIIKNRKFKLFLAAISLFLLLDLIQDTYAKYISSSDANSSLSIARWSFLVNNQDIISNQNFSNTIVPVYDQNANIKNGVIAPTSTGYFDITIDSSNVDVSFNQQITLSKNNTNTISDLVFTGYKKNNDQIVTLNDANTTTITNTHLLTDQTTVNTYRFYIAWKDGTGETMDNADDTAATANGVASIDINLQFIQRASQ